MAGLGFSSSCCCIVRLCVAKRPSRWPPARLVFAVSVSPIVCLLPASKALGVSPVCFCGSDLAFSDFVRFRLNWPVLCLVPPLLMAAFPYGPTRASNPIRLVLLYHF